MKSTDKTAVQKIAPGTYRVVEVGDRSAITGRYVQAINAARHAWTTTNDDTEITTGSAGRHTTTTRATATSRFVTNRAGAKSAK